MMYTSIKHISCFHFNETPVYNIGKKLYRLLPHMQLEPSVSYLISVPGGATIIKKICKLLTCHHVFYKSFVTR